ncbi:MAG: DUF2508 family protein [Clostridium butyricum]|nr:DUF2508 family protein [Clostridium butyricum]
MNRKCIHNNFLNKEYLLDKDYMFNSEKLLKDMKIAKMEIDMARNMFNNVEDTALIDIAIYSEDIAKKRYGYLLSIAKKNGISVSKRYIIENNLFISEY